MGYQHTLIYEHSTNGLHRHVPDNANIINKPRLPDPLACCMQLTWRILLPLQMDWGRQTGGTGGSGGKNRWQCHGSPRRAATQQASGGHVGMVPGNNGSWIVLPRCYTLAYLHAQDGHCQCRNPALTVSLLGECILRRHWPAALRSPG